MPSKNAWKDFSVSRSIWSDAFHAPHLETAMSTNEDKRNSNDAEASKSEESFTRETVETVRMDIPVGKLRWDAKTFSFRDQSELKKDAAGIKALADDIREAGGLLTPLLVQKSEAEGGTFLVLDGHRRKLAIESLMDSQSAGWTAETTIPANVITSPAAKLELLLRAASANVLRTEFSKTDRARVATALFEEGCPKSEIMRLLMIKDSQLERDLLVGRTPWMLDHIASRNITHSQAATLLAAAEKHDRVAEFRDEFDLWVANTKKTLRTKNAERRRNDQKELDKDQLYPQRYLKSDQVRAWMDALKADREFEEPSFKFKALIASEGGVKKVQIDSLNIALADLSAKDLAKVYQRVTDLSQQLEPVLMTKATSEPDAGEQQPSLGQERLLALGLESLVSDDVGTDGEDDELFDESFDRVEHDATDTIEFPSDDAERDDDGDSHETDEQSEDLS